MPTARNSLSSPFKVADGVGQVVVVWSRTAVGRASVMVSLVNLRRRLRYAHLPGSASPHSNDWTDGREPPSMPDAALQLAIPDAR